VVADAQSLPFDNESFDVVTCNHTLYHVPDKDRALTEFVRVLRTRGRFAGIYNTPAHLAELWGAVGADSARAGSRAHRAIRMKPRLEGTIYFMVCETSRSIRARALGSPRRAGALTRKAPWR